MPLRENWLHDREYFYKYLTAATAKTVLKTRQLRLSHPALFNDPFDLQFDLHVGFDMQSIKPRALEMLWNVTYEGYPVAAGTLFGHLLAAQREKFPRLTREEFNKEFGEAFDLGIDNMRRYLPEYQSETRAIADKITVLCLTEKHDDILMWSHYADCHKGVVLEFRCLPHLDSAMGAAQAVTYSKEMPTLFDEEFLVNLLAGRTMMDPAEIAKKQILTKADRWSYEKEWRLYLPHRTSTTHSFLSLHREEVRDGPGFRDSLAAWLRWILGLITPPIFLAPCRYHRPRRASCRR
ncbi:MAG: DUF2971 domain-containing protein, partial [Alphaproteobacteria bacterium]|nr:DUF2971 domain-containing protein [Alphaproteobacteria bacterium]